MPKLLQINVTANWGSTGRIAEQIGALAIEQGWKSYIAYGRTGCKSKSQLIKIGNKYSTKLHGLETRIFDNHGLSSRLATKSFINQIKLIQPDIIHLHNIHGYYLNYKILFDFLKESKTPVVWTLHDCWAFTGHCGYFSFQGCNRWKSICYDCPLKNSYPSAVLFDRSRKNYIDKGISFNSVENITLVPVSDWLGSMVKDSFLSSKKKFRIYNGIDTSVFKPYPTEVQLQVRKQYQINESDFVLLGCATAWGKRKGIFDYIKLAEHLDSKTKIVLVGIGDEWKAKLPSNILTIPRTGNVEELAKLYSAADIVMNLSYEETFGLTTVEGFACGTPSIVYNATASPELITKETGCVVEPGNVEEVLKAIARIKESGKSFYSKSCRERAISYFDKNDSFLEYVNLYRLLLDNK